MENKKHIYFYRNLNNEFVKTEEKYINKRILFRSQAGDYVYCLNHHCWEKFKECTTDGFTTIDDEHFEGFVVNYCSAQYIWDALLSENYDDTKKVRDENGIQFATIFFDMEIDYQWHNVTLKMWYIGREKYSKDTKEWFDNVSLKNSIIKFPPWWGGNFFQDYSYNYDSIPKNVFDEYLKEIGKIYNSYSKKIIDTKDKDLELIEELHLFSDNNKVLFYPDLQDNKIYVSKNLTSSSNKNAKLYNSIQEAIDNAFEDDQILILTDGYYYEDLIINKRVKIKSESGNAIIIPKTETGIRIEGDCYLEDLIFTNEIPSYLINDSEVLHTKKENKSPLITIKDSKPRLDYCTIYKADGNGIFVENAAPEFIRCDIARSTDANIYVTGKSYVEVTECNLCYSKESCGLVIAGDSIIRVEKSHIFKNGSSGIKAIDNTSGRIIETKIHQNKEYGFEDHSVAFIEYIYVGDCYWNGKGSCRDFYNNPL